MRSKPSWGLTLTVLVAFLALLGLGFWQLARRAETLARIATIEAQLNKPPVAMDVLERAAERKEPIAYRRVTVSGRFDHSQELFWFTQGPSGQPGLHVITPLKRASGPPVLIDRGFVPEALRDPVTRAEGQVKGLVTVTGIARATTQGGLFTPAPDRAKRIWYVRDLAALAESLGLEAVAPVLVEAGPSENPGGWPLGGQTVIAVRNNHLGYAMTWFGLAFGLLGVYLGYQRARARPAKDVPGL